MWSGVCITHGTWSNNILCKWTTLAKNGRISTQRFFGVCGIGGGNHQIKPNMLI
jgi:hypothetical protein